MFPDLSHLPPHAVNGLVPEGVVLAAGVLAARFALRGRPVWQFLCRFAVFAGFTVLLAAADVAPVMPAPAIAWTVAYVTISVFKAAWWLAAAWLVAGVPPRAPGVQAEIRRDPLPAGPVRRLRLCRRGAGHRCLRPRHPGQRPAGGIRGNRDRPWPGPAKHAGRHVLGRRSEPGQALPPRRLGDPGRRHRRPGGRDQLEGDADTHPHERPCHRAEQHHRKDQARERQRAFRGTPFRVLPSLVRAGVRLRRGRVRFCHRRSPWVWRFWVRACWWRPGAG